MHSCTSGTGATAEQVFALVVAQNKKNSQALFYMTVVESIE